MKSHFLNLLSASLTLLSVRNKGQWCPSCPSPSHCARHVPAKASAVTRGGMAPSYAQQHLQTHPSGHRLAESFLERARSQYWVGEEWQGGETCILGEGLRGQKLQGHNALRLWARAPQYRGQINTNALVLKRCSGMSPSSPLISITKQVLHCHLWQKALVKEKL